MERAATKGGADDGERDYDYLVVGSGFGGSVAALRLVEKGYSVLVLESGRRFRDEDFPKTNWNLRRFLFMPRLGLRGIMRMDFFRGLMVLSGAGVGGGSLVYANTLIEPGAEAFRNGTWPRVGAVDDWGRELRAHYAEARRMLGVVPAPTDYPADRALREAAEALGYGASFHGVDIGVYLGAPGVAQPDPYFGGEGPERSGCTFCGGCMIGCRNNAKNTLVKNYLYLAEKRGVQVWAETEATVLRPLERGGYEVGFRRPGLWGGRTGRVRAGGVVLAAGVLGTLRLLLRCRDEERSLPALSPTLGREVRTNSESIIGVRVPGARESFAQGVAIAAGVNADPQTKIEAVRYPLGSDLMALLTLPILSGRTLARRILQLVYEVGRRPRAFARGMWPPRFARETIILLVMQSLDSKLRFVWKKRRWPWSGRHLATAKESGPRPPVRIPAGNQFAETLARLAGGEAGGSVADLLGMSLTAHILGGCPMGRDARDGVIGDDHRVFNYPGLFIVGGAAVPANLGVNPSLTITAMAERAMEKVPLKRRLPSVRQDEAA